MPGFFLFLSPNVSGHAIPVPRRWTEILKCIFVPSCWSHFFVLPSIFAKVYLLSWDLCSFKSLVLSILSDVSHRRSTVFGIWTVNLFPSFWVYPLVNIWQRNNKDRKENIFLFLSWREEGCSFTGHLLGSKPKFSASPYKKWKSGTSLFLLGFCITAVASVASSL